MSFEPGQSGNPGGRPKTKPFKDALLIEALSAERGEECLALPGSLRWNARKLLEQGEVASIREIADRLDGKVPQAVVGDDESDPISLVHVIERRLVRPANDNGRPQNEDWSSHSADAFGLQQTEDSLVRPDADD